MYRWVRLHVGIHKLIVCDWRYFQNWLKIFSTYKYLHPYIKHINWLKIFPKFLIPIAHGFSIRLRFSCLFWIERKITNSFSTFVQQKSDQLLPYKMRYEDLIWNTISLFFLYIQASYFLLFWICSFWFLDFTSIIIFVSGYISTKKHAKSEKKREFFCFFFKNKNHGIVKLG